jgi:hypothetical protein
MNVRKKWLEKVEFISGEINSMGIKPKLVMHNGGNGDLYLSVCPHNHRFGTTIRIERSGGAATRNPRLVKALTAAYDAIADNDDIYFNGIDVSDEVKDDLKQLEYNNVGYDYNSTIKKLIKFYKEHHPEIQD